MLRIVLVPEPFAVLARGPAGQIADGFPGNITPYGIAVMTVLAVEHDLGGPVEFMSVFGSPARESVGFALNVTRTTPAAAHWPARYTDRFDAIGAACEAERARSRAG